MLCPRKDLGANDQVEVLLHADSPNATYMDGVITEVTWQRWECRSKVLNCLSEVTYTIDDTDGLKWVRHVDLMRRAGKTAELSEPKIAPYLKQPTRDEMLHIYEATAGEEGEDAYLCDGVWISHDGLVKSSN